MGDQDLQLDQPGSEPAANGTEPAQQAQQVDVDAIASQAAERAAERIAPALNDIAGWMEQASAKLNAAGAPAQPGTAPQGPDFYTDPEGAAAEIARRAVGEAMEPLHKMLSTSTTGNVIRDERTAHDEVYGPGNFDTEMLPMLQVALNSMTDEQKANEAHVRSIVAAIRGRSEVQSKLHDARVAFEKAKLDKAAEDEEKAMGTGALTGGVRRTTAPDVLSDEEGDFLTRWNKNVPQKHRISKEQYLAARERIVDGSTAEEDWTQEGAAA